MIYTPFLEGTNHTCTKIIFRGFEISIAMDNRGIDGRPLTRSSLIVCKDEQDVTAQLVGLLKDVGMEGIRDCTSEDLFDVMAAIAKLDPENDDSGGRFEKFSAAL